LKGLTAIGRISRLTAFERPLKLCCPELPNNHEAKNRKKYLQINYPKISIKEFAEQMLSSIKTEQWKLVFPI